MTNTQKIVRTLVEDYYKLDITINTRKRPYIEARAIYYKLLRDHTHYSLHAIGATMQKDHSTVLYFTRKAKDWLLYDKDFENDYLTLNNRLVKAKELNPDAFKRSQTLEGFWEGQYTKINEQLQELEIRYKYLQSQLKKVNPDLAEQFELTNT
jgi:hypothetical protein